MSIFVNLTSQLVRERENLLKSLLHLEYFQVKQKIISIFERQTTIPGR